MKKGFTLVELLVVIAIIGLLSTLAVVTLNTARLEKCARGDYATCRGLDMTREEAKKKLGNEESERIEIEGVCDERRHECKFDCADSDNDFKDCLSRCTIKYEYCIEKNK